MPSPALTWVPELRDLIADAMLRRTLDDPPDQHFIPYDDLIRVWKKPTLGTPPSSALERFRNDVKCFPTAQSHLPLGPWIRVVSVLIWIRYEHLVGFLEGRKEVQWRRPVSNTEPEAIAGFNDDSLPFTRKEIGQYLFSDSGSDRDAAVEFYSSQFAFKPVVLEEDQLCEFADKNYRLPLKTEGEINDTGSYGDVTRVTIARKHYRYRARHLVEPALNDVEFDAARKEFDVGHNFAHEYRNLKILRSSHFADDVRIMQSFTSAIIGPKYNLFFPWADLDLERFLQGEYLYDNQQASITLSDLICEVRQLIIALQFLHGSIQFEGRKVAFCHLDLKPNNILIVRQRNRDKFPLGMWKITDFGISGVEARAENEAQLVSARELFVRTNRTRTDRGTSIELERFPGPFQPPEAETGIAVAFKRMGMSTPGIKSDIWSGGCIILSVLAFGIGGPTCVDRLNALLQTGRLCPDEIDRRGYFYRKGENDIHVAPAVRKWFEKMACFKGGWLIGIWNVVAEHTLKIYPQERESAAFVAERLESFERQCPRQNIWAEPWTDGSLPTPDVSSVRAVAASQRPPLNWDQYLTQPTSSSSRPPVTGSAPSTPLVRPDTYQNVATTRHPDPITTHNSMGTIIEVAENPGLNAQEPATPISSSVQGTSRNHSVAMSLTTETSSATRGSDPSKAGDSNQPLLRFELGAPVELEVHSEELVKVSADGSSILYQNKDRVKLFLFTEEGGCATFASERVRYFPRTGKQKWDEAHISGQCIALRTNDTGRGNHGQIHVGVVEDHNPPDQTLWASKVNNKDVIAVSVSICGYVAFGHQTGISVFDYNGVPQNIGTRTALRGLRNGVKHIAFDRTGRIVTAVSVNNWFACNLADPSDTVSSEHRFFRGEHGEYNPSIIPLNNIIGFILHDNATPGRCTFITRSADARSRYCCNDFRLEDRPFALAVTPDNSRLVYVTVRRHFSSTPFRTKYEYELRVRAINIDERIPIGVKDISKKLMFTEDKCIPISIATVSTSGGWAVLAARTNGKVECLAIE